jgi:hypothetical protein
MVSFKELLQVLAPLSYGHDNMSTLQLGTQIMKILTWWGQE